MPASTPYINAVELDIVPSEFENYKAAILENSAASVKEPGCRQFDVLASDEDPHRVVLYEIYDDAGAFDAHLASPHYKSFATSTGDMIATRSVRRLDYWGPDGDWEKRNRK